MPNLYDVLGPLSIVAGLLPAVFYAWLLWRLDRYEREPLVLLVVAFLAGAVPAIGLSALVEIAMVGPVATLAGSYSRLVGSGLVAPLVEEGAKALALLALFAAARHEFDDVLDGIIYGGMVGLGFAMTENIAYFLNARAAGDLGSWATVVVGRGIAFGFNHALFTSLTGIGVALSRFATTRRRRWTLVALGYLAAVAAHSLHNFLLHASDYCLLSFVANWLGILFSLFVIGLTWRRERSWLSAELASEVAVGLLTQQQLNAITSQRWRWQRAARELGASSTRDARLWHDLTQAASELAFRKHQLAGAEVDTLRSTSLNDLRASVSSASKRLGSPRSGESAT